MWVGGWRVEIWGGIYDWLGGGVVEVMFMVESRALGCRRPLWEKTFEGVHF